MAMRAPGVGYDQLHHFIGSALWDSAPLEEELCRQSEPAAATDLTRHQAGNPDPAQPASAANMPALP